MSQAHECRRRLRVASPAAAALYLLAGLSLALRYPDSAAAVVAANGLAAVILFTFRPLAGVASTRGVAALAALMPIVGSLAMAATIGFEPATFASAMAALGITAIGAPLLLDWDTSTSRRWATCYAFGVGLLVLLTGFGSLSMDQRLDVASLVAACSLVGVLAANLVQGLRLRSIEQEQELRRLNRVLHGYATTDPLTQLRNRRQLDGDVAIIWPTIRRGGETCAVLMLDLDHFKHLNDARGHAAGDTTLRSVAMELERQVRGRDSVYRVGGEEFLVLLRDTAFEDGVQVAERIRKAVANLGVPLGNGADPNRLTISCGLAVADDRAASWQAVAAAADAALYAAKEAGRDRVFGPGGAVVEAA